MNEKDIRPTNENGKPHGYWEVYDSITNCYDKRYYVNGIRTGYSETYFYNKTFVIKFHL